MAPPIKKTMPVKLNCTKTINKIENKPISQFSVTDSSCLLSSSVKGPVRSWVLVLLLLSLWL